MTGEYRHILDNKGRITIPSQIRNETGNVIYITISADKCLSVFSKEGWESLSKKVSNLPLSKQNAFRSIFSYAVKCEIDSQGRVLIPHYLREWAKLSKNVIVIGNNDHAEIWNISDWDNYINTKSETLYSVMEDLII